jgi:ribose transport system substrate-binding protein
MVLTRRRFGIRIVALTVSAFLIGCGPKEETAGTGTPAPAAGGNSGGGAKKKVGVSLSSRNHNFFLGMEQGVKDELEAQGIEAEIVVAENSASTQQQQIDTFIRKKVDAIIMVPVDAEQAITPVEAANKAGIPIFCIDRRITDPRAKVTSTIETDNVAMGEVAAKYALKLLCDRYKLDSTNPEEVKKLKTTVVHLWGFKAASSAQDRAKGFEKVFNETATPGVKVIEEVGEFNPKKAQEVMAPLLSANRDVELVFSHGDDNSLGALNAILDIKKQREPATDPKRIFLVGMDGNKPAIEKIRSGEIEATVSQEPIEMGHETVKQVKKVLDGGQPDKEYLPIRHHLVTKKEADEMTGKLWSDQLRETR